MQGSLVCTKCVMGSSYSMIMTQNKSKLCQDYLRKKEQDGKLENMMGMKPHPAGVDRRVKVKKPTSVTFTGTSATDMRKAFYRISDFYCRKSVTSVFSSYFCQRWLL